MKKILVYDLPTRIFHWLLAGFFLTAFIIAKTIDDESPTYAFHMLAGLCLGFLVVLRLIWGLFGTKHARFTGFSLHPADLLSYLKGVLTGDDRRWAGHNPASSWAGLIMLLLGLGLAVTGFLMTSGPNKETFEDVHELFANTFIIVVILHVAGIIIHTLRHKEMIALSMIDGRKSSLSVNDQIPTSRPVVGILLLALIVAFVLNLSKHYDPSTQKLQLFGTTLQLGENEDEPENESGPADLKSEKESKGGVDSKQSEESDDKLNEEKEEHERNDD